MQTIIATWLSSDILTALHASSLDHVLLHFQIADGCCAF